MLRYLALLFFFGLVMVKAIDPLFVSRPARYLFGSFAFGVLITSVIGITFSL